MHNKATATNTLSFVHHSFRHGLLFNGLKVKDYIMKDMDVYYYW